ncbi:MAG TPA: FG-GAP-like repeat-containing protein [Candidatus Krumholzibacteria bacterium]|nr:FG-GAP-like repeat-containing protein [Candidatus Krumholzibacteria bacterium]
MAKTLQKTSDRTYRPPPRLLVPALVAWLVIAIAPTASALEWAVESTESGNIPAPNPGDEQTACLVGDLDGDGRDDVVVAERTESPAVTVFFRRDTGWERAVIDTSTLPIEAGGALGDVDGDGDLDVSFGGDYRSNRVWWWENPGPPPYPTEGWARRLIKDGGADKHHDQAFGDFDADGDLELAFWNQGAGGVLYLAEIPADPTTAGTWSRTAIFDGPDDSEGLATGDVDGNGTIDLIGAGHWFEFTGGTSFTAHLVADGRAFTRSAVGQLVEGGRPEIVIVPGDADGPLVWYQWDGATWQANELDPDVENGHSLEIVDVDRDGRLDLFVAEMHTPGAGSDAESRVFLSQGGGNLVAETISVGTGNHESKFADVNADGRPDLVGKPYTNGAPGLNVWLQTTSNVGGAFDTDAACLVDDGDGLSVRGVDALDLDHDGNIDAVVRTVDGGVRALYGPDHTTSTIPTGVSLSATAWADVESDGDLDLIGATTGGASDLVWFANPGDRSGDWAQTTIAAVGDSVGDLKIGDLDATGALDVVALARSSAVRASTFDGQDWTSSSFGSTTTSDPRGWIADLDADGDLDMGRGGSWWRNDGSSWAAFALPGDLGPRTRAWTADPDRDGKTDLLTVDPDVCGEIRWIDNDARTGPREIARLGGLALGRVEDLRTLDVDRDGDLDVVLAGRDCNDAARSVLLRSDGGPLSGWTIETIASSNALAASDLDRDGDVDLFLGSESGTCRLAEARNVDPSGSSLGNWQRHVLDADRPWRAVFVLHGDIDRDGDVDAIGGGWWYENPGTPDGDWTRRTIGAPLNTAAVVADLDHDGDLDVLGTEGKGSDDLPIFAWARNDGAGNFTVTGDIATGEGDFLQGVAHGRFTTSLQNGVVPEAVALSWHARGNGIELLTVPADPSTGAWSLTDLSTFTQNEQLQAGDIDRDGDLDLSTGTAWMRNDGGGAWSSVQIASSAQPPDRHRLIDLDHDGRLDIVMGVEAIGETGPVTWYRQPSDPTASWPGTEIATVIGPMSLDTADLDLDGDLDVVVGEHDDATPEDSRLLVLENGGDGTWTEHLVYQGDEHHDGANLVDIDGDGDLDVLSVSWFRDTVTLYENLAVDETVSPPDDVTPPSLVFTRSTEPDLDRILARFSEAVDPVSAVDPAHYLVQPSVDVLDVTLQSDGRTVWIDTAPMTVGTTYELSTDGVRDLASTPNATDGTDRSAFVHRPWNRVDDAQVALWDFERGRPGFVLDVDPDGTPLDLVIADTTRTSRTDGGLDLTSAVSVRSPDPAVKIVEACRASDAVTVEAWVRPSDATQTGPARIVTVSQDRYLRNVTLSQGKVDVDSDHYSARIRTGTKDNGLPTFATDGGTVQTTMQHVVLTRDAAGTARIWVDGELAVETTRSGTFDDWDPSHGVAIAGEYAFGTEVAWTGTIHLAAIHDRALTGTEITTNFEAGADASSGVTAVDTPTPRRLLASVTPNPFNAHLDVELGLSRATTVTLVVYDLRGRLVRTLLDEAELPRGTHGVEWDGADDGGEVLASGVYLLRATTPRKDETRKITLAK